MLLEHVHLMNIYEFNIIFICCVAPKHYLPWMLSAAESIGMRFAERLNVKETRGSTPQCQSLNEINLFLGIPMFQVAAILL